MNDMLFVTIAASDNVSKADFIQVCNSLQLSTLAMQVGFVDIDKAYEKKFGKKASEIRQIRFNMPLEMFVDDDTNLIIQTEETKETKISNCSK